MNNAATKILGSLHVTDLARNAKVTPATIRYYARIGLIHPNREPENGYRCFSGSDLRRVLFVRQAQALGLTIGDIKTILATVDDGDVPCNRVKALVEERLASITTKIAELLATEVRIQSALSAWKGLNAQAPAEGELCPLIERLEASSQDPSHLSWRTRRRSYKTRRQSSSSSEALA